MHKLLYMLGGMKLLLNKIIITNYGENSLSIIDKKDLTEISRISLKKILPGKTGFTRIIVEDNDRALILDSDTDSLYRIDIYKQKLLGCIKLGRSPIRIKTLGDRIYVLNIDSNSLSIIDKEDLTIIENIYLGEKPTDLAIDSLTGNVYITNLNGFSISLIDYKNGHIEEIKLKYMPFRIKLDLGILYVLGFSNNNTLGYSILSAIDTITKMTIWQESLEGIYFDFVKLEDRNLFYLVNSENSCLYEFDKDKKKNSNKIHIGGLTNHITSDLENLYLNDMVNNQLVVVKIGKDQIKKRIAVGREPHDILLT